MYMYMHESMNMHLCTWDMCTQRSADSGDSELDSIKSEGEERRGESNVCTTCRDQGSGAGSTQPDKEAILLKPGKSGTS